MYAPPQQAFAPPQQGYAPQQQAYATMQPTYAPQQQGYAAPQQAYATMQPTFAPQQAYAPVLEDRRLDPLSFPWFSQAAPLLAFRTGMGTIEIGAQRRRGRHHLLGQHGPTRRRAGFGAARFRRRAVSAPRRFGAAPFLAPRQFRRRASFGARPVSAPGAKIDV
jgi:hypothetical protein